MWKRFYSRPGMTLEFVPDHMRPTSADVKALSHFLLDDGGTLVLTGAGVSTESGIPDYRSEKVGLFTRESSRQPIKHQEFIKSDSARKRYWARNYVGWPRWSMTWPNIIHRRLVEMEKSGIVSHVVTQNVDGLHSKAGHVNVVELHGSTYQVRCLSCGHFTSRHTLQQHIQVDNQGWGVDVSAALAPDGDVELTNEQVEGFITPTCRALFTSSRNRFGDPTRTVCGGILKPDVVFFGDNVPGIIVEQVVRLVESCKRLICLGTSLHVYSAYRVTLLAHKLGKPIAIVNIGHTRADHLTQLKINTKCGDLFDKLRV